MQNKHFFRGVTYFITTKITNIMSIIDRVVYYLNDVLVSLDISPILKAESKRERTKMSKDKTDTQA